MKINYLLKYLMAALFAASITVSGVNAETLRIGGVLPTGVENAWSGTYVESLQRVKAAKPHGLEIEFTNSEGVWANDALVAMEQYAAQGYDIVWGHSSYPDAVEELKDEFPDTLFVLVGSGNQAFGDNAYLVYTHIHEPAYLGGIFAASESKKGVLGVVGLFPADDINDQVNGFRAGAQSINPNVKVKVTFIESWYDPVKAAEAANAQIAAGADIIFQLGESFETCREAGIMCIGNYRDESKSAPDVVPVSVMVSWEPHLNYIIDEWKKHKDSGNAYAAPKEPVWFTMAQGSGSLSPVSAQFTDKVSAETIAAVSAARDAILSGDLTVELNMSLPVSD